MIMDFELAKSMLTFEEGDKRFIYDDVTGQRVYAGEGILTGGIGHNFESRPMSDAVVNIIFNEDWSIALETCQTIFRNYMTLSQARQLALLNMAFNLGEYHLVTFKKMTEAILALDFDKASDEILNSLWATQLKSRATRVAHMLKTDQIPIEYL